MDDRRIAHGNGQMRAQSISIQVSTRTRCNAGCLFCISRTTPGVDDQQSSSDIKFCDIKRLRTGLEYANVLGATHAILTGRADPSQEDVGYLAELIEECRMWLPLVDVHTNGFLWLPKRNPTALNKLVDAGLTMITLSIASFVPSTNEKVMGIREGGAQLINYARELGLLVRCSCVVNAAAVHAFGDTLQYIADARSFGAHMVVVRELWTPEVFDGHDSDVYNWNTKNQVDVISIQEQFEAMSLMKNNVYGIRQRTPLPWGTPVFTVKGVNVTFSRCNEAADGYVLKSIVHRPDGHGYRNWDDTGDILY